MKSQKTNSYSGELPQYKCKNASNQIHDTFNYILKSMHYTTGTSNAIRIFHTKINIQIPLITGLKI